MGVRAAQDLAVEHSGERDVVRVAGPPRRLGHAVDLAHRFSDRGVLLRCRRAAIGLHGSLGDEGVSLAAAAATAS